MPFDIDRLLEAVLTNEASDLHLRVGLPPKIRLQGRMRTLGKVVLTDEDMQSLMKSITSERNRQELDDKGSTDYGFAFRDQTRFRASVFRHQTHIGMVFRMIPGTIRSMEELDLPAVLKELCMRPRGLFLVTGPTGSGKSTTLAAMIDYINERRTDHIITIEDPIEFVHQPKNCVITQREVGVDTPSFSEALRRALRQDPDIILVGEMRDLETISSAITASETGHLVFGTLHTNGAQSTINRIVDAFPTNQQEQVRTQLAQGLIGVVSQTLVPTKAGSRLAAFEVMINNHAIRAMIRKNETFKINSAIQTGADQGMFTLDDSLFNLYQTGEVAFDELICRACQPDELENKIRQYRKELEAQRKG